MKNKKGFTLIELLLYIGIGSVVLLIITVFFQNNLEARAKVKAMSEVNQQGMQIIELINQTIANAESINSPLAGNSSPTLSLNVVDAIDDPTIFGQSGNNIYMTEGAGGPLILNSPLLAVSNLSFINMSRSGTAGNIKIQFTLSFVNNSGRAEYNFSKTFYSGVSLR